MTEQKWSWWVGRNGEHYDTECATLEEAIQIARDDYEGAYIIEATQPNLRLASFFDADDFITAADENAVENYGGEDCDTVIELSEAQIDDLQEAVRKAIEDWQVKTGLIFEGYTFAATRNGKYIKGAGE